MAACSSSGRPVEWASKCAATLRGGQKPVKNSVPYRARDFGGPDSSLGRIRQTSALWHTGAGGNAHGRRRAYREPAVPRRDGVAGRAPGGPGPPRLRLHDLPRSRSRHRLCGPKRPARLGTGTYPGIGPSRPPGRAVGCLERAPLHHAGARAVRRGHVATRRGRRNPRGALQRRQRDVGGAHLVDAAGVRVRRRRHPERRPRQVEGRGPAAVDRAAAGIRRPGSWRGRARR